MDSLNTQDVPVMCIDGRPEISNIYLMPTNEEVHFTLNKT